MGGGLFAAVVELTDVSIPGGFERVGGGLFAAVVELTDVSIPGGFERVGGDCVLLWLN